MDQMKAFGITVISILLTFCMFLIYLIFNVINTVPGLDEITLQDLQKKFENHETFWLVTLDATPKAIEEQGVFALFDDALKKQGLDAYYLNTSNLSEADKTALSTEYLHPFMATYGTGTTKWNVEDGGLVYVENGGVIQMSNQSNFSANLMAKQVITKTRVHKNVAKQIQMMQEYGLTYQTK